MKKREDWWEAGKDKVNRFVFEQVSRYERDQEAFYDRCAELEYLYDTSREDPRDPRTGQRRKVTQNLIASNVDTVYAIITAAGIRPRFMTDDGDWKTQRRATHLSWYSEGLSKLLGVKEVCDEAFKVGALKGMALTKAYIDPFRTLRITDVNVDDLIVNPIESERNHLRQLHQAMVRPVDELVAEYPGKAEEIEQACGMARLGQHWPDYRPVPESHCAVLESWYLPIGQKGKKGYRPGLHAICIHGCDLVNEPWEEDFFPFGEFRWSKKPRGWHGIGLAERIMGHQTMLDKFNWQMDLMIDKHAVPITYVPMADINVQIKTTNRAGTFIPTKTGQPPTTVIPPAVSPEMYNRASFLEDSAHRESGVSRLAAQAAKPAGIDSGAAMREYRDATTQRFAPQEKGHERLHLQTIWLALWCCKQLGKDAPVIVRRSNHGPRKIGWGDVDMGEVKVQMVAASTLSQTPAGRAQFVLEMAQGGVVSQDVARKLLMPHSPLDVEHEMSLYESAMQSADSQIEEILDGGVAVPEPYQNAKMNVWRGTGELLLAERRGYPERILENLRQWIVQSAWVVSQAEGAVAGDPAMAGQPAAPAPATEAGTAMTGAGVAAANLLQ